MYFDEQKMLKPFTLAGGDPWNKWFILPRAGREKHDSSQSFQQKKIWQL